MSNTEKKKFFIIIIMLVLWTSAGMGQSPDLNQFSPATAWSKINNDSVKTPVKSPTGAMIRSLIFPGWGQLYNGKIFKAILIFGAETGLIANSIYLNQKYKEWDQKYKKSEPGFDQDVIFANREFYINNRNASNWWLVGVILFSMADAFVDAHLSDFDESPNLSSINITPYCSGYSKGLQLSICMCF